MTVDPFCDILIYIENQKRAERRKQERERQRKQPNVPVIPPEDRWPTKDPLEDVPPMPVPTPTGDRKPVEAHVL